MITLTNQSNETLLLPTKEDKGLQYGALLVSTEGVPELVCLSHDPDTGHIRFFSSSKEEVREVINNLRRMHMGAVYQIITFKALKGN